MGKNVKLKGVNKRKFVVKVTIFCLLCEGVHDVLSFATFDCLDLLQGHICFYILFKFCVLMFGVFNVLYERSTVMAFDHEVQRPGSHSVF